MILRLLLFCFFSVSAWAGEHTDDLFNYSKRQDEVLVVKVTASNMLVLEDGRRVRLIGVESVGAPTSRPVKYDDKGRIIEEPQEPTISLEEQSLTYARDLLENKKVKLEYDVNGSDSSGHLYAYVYLPDGRMANVELLRMGFVKLRTIPPNVKYEDKLRAAYQEAKKEKRGLEGN